jgi:hypothetical protein
VTGDGDAEVRAQAWDHEDRDGKHEQYHHMAGALGGEALGAVPQSPDDEGQAEDEEHVGEDRADERGLDDADQAGAEREDPEEQLGEVAERGLHDSGHPRTEAIAQPVDAASDDGGEHAEGSRRHDEGNDAAGVDVVRDRRGGGEERGRAEKPDVAFGELGSHGRCLPSVVGLVGALNRLHSDPTLGPPASEG